MQLNKFTDYALRMLVYISRPSEAPYTIADIAHDLQVSQNHMVKIVHFLAKAGLVDSIRGKGGGVRLSPSALPLRLGDVVRLLQGNPQVVDCHKPACVFRYNCALKPILDQAMQCFYTHLNQYSLADVIQHMNYDLYSQQPSHATFAQAIMALNLDTATSPSTETEASSG